MQVFCTVYQKLNQYFISKAEYKRPVENSIQGNVTYSLIHTHNSPLPKVLGLNQTLTYEKVAGDLRISPWFPPL